MKTDFSQVGSLFEFAKHLIPCGNKREAIIRAFGCGEAQVKLGLLIFGEFQRNRALQNGAEEWGQRNGGRGMGGRGMGGRGMGAEEWDFLEP